MISSIWIHRLCAGAVTGLVAVVTVSAAGTVGDMLAVHQAAAAGRAGTAPSASLSRPIPPPAPLLRLNGATPAVAIGEYLNTQLGGEAVDITSVRTPSVRSLGGGVRLAEVHVVARGELGAMNNLLAWAAVNRKAIRMKSVSASTSPDGVGQYVFVMLMVVA